MNLWLDSFYMNVCNDYVVIGIMHDLKAFNCLRVSLSTKRCIKHLHRDVAQTTFNQTLNQSYKKLVFNLKHWFKLFKGIVMFLQRKHKMVQDFHDPAVWDVDIEYNFICVLINH